MNAKLFVVAALAVLGGLVIADRSRADDETPAGWGTIKGQVVLAGSGAVPEGKEIGQVDVHPDKTHCLSKGKLYTQDLVVNKKNRGIRNVFVWLAPVPTEPGEPKKKMPIHPDLAKIDKEEVEIDQPCCQFVPHALGIRKGQVLVAKNSAPVAHNVQWIGNPLRNPGGNVIVPPNGSYKIKGLNPDRFPVQVKCSIHPWMSGRVGVFDHPYFAVTDEDGNFKIDKAPAGTFRLFVWQEKVGWLGGVEGRNGQPITIKADGMTDVGKLNLEVPAE